MPRPFYNKKFDFSQADGTKIHLLGWGNQLFATFETEDGYTVVKNPETGFYDYAKLSDDKSYLETTGVRVGTADPATLGISKHLRISEPSATAMARATFGGETGLTRWQERIREKKTGKIMMMASNGIIAAPPERQTKGDYVGLCILIQFPDVPGTIPHSEVEKFCNQNGYAGFGNSGSVNDYFFEVSGERVNYTNIVTTSYYTAKHNRAYYTDESIPYGTRARELIWEALVYLKKNGFDFSALSADSEGYIYAINAFYAGAAVNEWRKGLWAHSSSLMSPFDVGGGRRFKDYQITDMGDELTLGTFCHENGHMICDFPDLYDYGFSGIQSSGVGHYCLMAFGGPDDKNPVHVCAYLKYKAGWADKVTSLADEIHVAKAGVNEFFKIAKNSLEYYIIEARNQENRDKSLPSAGLAVWHVDELGDNEYEDMTAYRHFECSLLQADNKFDLERGVNAGNSKDLFNKKNGSRLGESTKPHSKWWDGTPSGLEITEIGDEGNEIAFKFGTKGSANALKKTSSPAMFIPDNNLTGIKDKIVFQEDARVLSLKVDVDISHTYVGDLIVTLISPSGAQAIIHDKKGESEDDLKVTFDISSTPSLGNLIGQPIKGEWTLLVQDVSAIDKGTLNSWGLEIVAEGGMSKEINVEDAASQKIPDNNDAGITRSLNINAPGKAKNVEVTVDITHTYIGDLRVTLQSPKGTSIVLHNKFGAGQDNIIKTYSAATVPDLAKLAGETISGTWSLKVADLLAQDVGKLNRWSLKIIPE